MSTDSGYANGAYWQGRTDLMYYKYFFALMRCVAKDAVSLIDVGTGNSGYLEWLDWIPQKDSVDIRVPYESENVRGIKGDIHKLPLMRYDVCTCLQVLEHIPDPRTFAARLLELGSLVIISVPYNWPANKTKGHIHDPVDEVKIESWFGRKPNYNFVAKELFLTQNSARMFSIFDPADKSRKFGGAYWHSRRAT